MTKKLVQPKKASPRRLEEAVFQAGEDICKFHSYLREIPTIMDDARMYNLYRNVYGKVPAAMRSARDSKEMARVLYQHMQEIADKYPRNNSLKNKLDEAKKCIWPQGKR
jgi:hypothetical protein